VITCVKILTQVTHTHTREEAINAAGNVSGNVTVNVSCV